MTREEAIELLQETKSCHLKAVCEALDMAIEALQANAEIEACDTCKYYKTNHKEYPCSDCTFRNSHYVSAEAILQLNRIDTLIIANALRYLINDEERHELDRATAESLRERILKYGASICKGGGDE